MFETEGNPFIKNLIHDLRRGVNRNLHPIDVINNLKSFNENSEYDFGQESLRRQMLIDHGYGDEDWTVFATISRPEGEINLEGEKASLLEVLPKGIVVELIEEGVVMRRGRTTFVPRYARSNNYVTAIVKLDS